MPAITRENPLRLAKLLILNKLKLAERVGFVSTGLSRFGAIPRIQAERKL